MRFEFIIFFNLFCYNFFSTMKRDWIVYIYIHTAARRSIIRPREWDCLRRSVPLRMRIICIYDKNAIHSWSSMRKNAVVLDTVLIGGVGRYASRESDVIQMAHCSIVVLQKIWHNFQINASHQAFHSVCVRLVVLFFYSQRRRNLRTHCSRTVGGFNWICVRISQYVYNAHKTWNYFTRVNASI